MHNSGDFDPGFVDSLKIQSWSLYSVGILMIALRMFARYKRLRGFRHYQIDDYLMVLTAILYTTLIICLNVISQGGGSNLYPPELAGTFTDKEIDSRIFGSKIVMVSEQAMLNVIYTLKACMLIMYTRLTLGHTAQKWVRVLAVYVFVGWAGTEVAFFTACRPFEGYWAMPPPSPQCATLEYFAYVQGCFNISSDIVMLFIPLPLVIGLQAPWRQKVVLVFIFSMGIFIILAALLTKIFNLSNIWEPGYMLWYTREASVAVYVSNLPMIWPLLREWFPRVRSWVPGKHSSDRNGDLGPREDTLRLGHCSTAKSAMRGGTAFPTISRARGPCHAGGLDAMYDIEMALKETSPEEGHDDVNSSTEQIISHTPAEDNGGIRVEVTVQVVQGRSSTDGSTAHDAGQPGAEWARIGGVGHTADASRSTP